MNSITRDLYTNGNVWISLVHSFKQNNQDGSQGVDLVKSSNGFVTLNAGAFLVLSLWSKGVRAPAKFYIPEYKIVEFRAILEKLYSLKQSEEYVLDNELTAVAHPSNLYYRLSLANSKYIDCYMSDVNYNGEKYVMVTIELEGNTYSLYDSNLLEIIDILPGFGELTRYKQDAAQLYYMENFLLKGLSVGSSGSKTIKQVDRSSVKKSAPRTVGAARPTKAPKNKPVSQPVPEPATEAKPETVEQVVEEPAQETSQGEFDYSSLLSDE